MLENELNDIGGGHLEKEIDKQENSPMYNASVKNR